MRSRLLFYHSHCYSISLDLTLKANTICLNFLFEGVRALHFHTARMDTLRGQVGLFRQEIPPPGPSGSGVQDQWGLGLIRSAYKQKAMSVKGNQRALSTHLARCSLGRGHRVPGSAGQGSYWINTNSRRLVTQWEMHLRPQNTSASFLPPSCLAVFIMIAYPVVSPLVFKGSDLPRVPGGQQSTSGE